MTLLITVFAVVISTVIWYTHSDRKPRLGSLCFLYWGVGLMWPADAVFEYLQLHEAFFVPSPEKLINDIYHGLFVVVLGSVIWLVSVIIKDQNGAIRGLTAGKNRGDMG